MAVLCVAGQTFTLEFSLEDQSNAGLFKADPTIAAGDFTISVNGGAFENVDNIPTVAPASGERVALVIAAAETTAAGAGGLIFIRCKDAAGDEWYDTSMSVRVHAATGDAALTGDAMTLANDAITAAKIAANAIGASEIADAAIDAATFAAGAITAGAIAANAITSSEIADGAIDAGAIATDAITAAKIAADAITSSEFATTAAQEIADEVLKRGVSNVEGAASSGSLAEMILACFESALADTTWTIYKTDHATTFSTRTVTTDATASPIIEVT